MGEERSSIPQLSIQSRSEYGRTKRLLYGWRNGAVFTPMTTRRAAKSFKTSTILTSSSTSSTTTSQRNLASGICSTKCFKLEIISGKIKRDHQRTHCNRKEERKRNLFRRLRRSHLLQWPMQIAIGNKICDQNSIIAKSPVFFLQISFSVFLLQMSFRIYFCVHIIFVVSQYAYLLLCVTSCHFLFLLYHEFQRMYHFLPFVTAASKILYNK